MIRALTYTDLQATEGPERCFSQPGLPLQRWRVDQFYQKLLQIYRELDCNALWDLGDTTDDRSAIPIPALRSVREGLIPFRGNPHNIKLTGNHEQYTRNTEIDNSCVFNDIFNVVKGVQVFEWEEVAIVACSYPASQVQMMEQIESQLLKYRKKPIIVLGHLEISGTKMKSGTSITGMPVELFAPSVITLLGHIHLPQQIGENIFYVGSPFQQDFGEAGEAKRLGLVTIDRNIISLDWIPLAGFPEYQTVSWPEFEQNFDPNSENRYKVKISSPDEAAAFYKHPHSARVYPDYDYQMMTTQLPGQEGVTKDWSLQAAIKRWVETCDPALKDIPITPEELVQFGLQVAEGEAIK